MRQIIFLSLIILAPALYAEDDATCHIHKSQPIHFRDYKVQDVLEVSVGPGPCATALMTQIIRSEQGEVLYFYVGRFATHVTPDPYDPNFDKFIPPFLDNLKTDAQKMSKSMPKYHKQDAANGLIKLHVRKKSYDKLRLRHIPVFYHLNSHDSWQYVVFDKKKGRGKVVVSGQVGGMY